MIISTSKKKPLTFFFLIFNFIIFWIFEFFLLKNNITKDELIFVATVTLFVSFFTSVLYITFDIYLTFKLEQKIFDTSTYVREYGASVFNGYGSIFLFKLKDEVHNISVNETFLNLTQYPADRREYIMNLRICLFTLTETDLLVIYLNKYVQHFLNSALFFVIWQRCMLGSIKEGIIIQIIMVLIVYHVISILLKKAISRYMKKHKLEIFNIN